MSNQWNDVRLDQITDDVLSMDYDEVSQHLGQYRSLEGWDNGNEDDAYDKLIVMRYEDEQFWINL